MNDQQISSARYGEVTRPPNVGVFALRWMLFAVSVLWLIPADAWAQGHLVGRMQGSTWKLLDDGSDPGAGWHQPDFDDDAWRSGVAPLGYGDWGVQTVVRWGSDESKKPITTYFRHTFSLQQIPEGSVVLLLNVDDGAVVFLNGDEIARRNMPGGVITSATPANRTVAGAEELDYASFNVPRSAMRVGNNVIAAEVHQAYPSSSDVRFDLALRLFDPDDRQPVAPPSGATISTRLYSDEHYVPAQVPLPDGFADGGRHSTVEDGVLQSGREILMVNRSRDAELRLHLSFASTDELKRLPPLQRAQRIARYVDKQMTPPAGRAWALLDAFLLQNEYKSREMLLGDVTSLFEGGMCRHRALLFKLMGDEAELDVALVRGSLLVGDDRREAHSWNELHLPEGRTLIVDTMNPLRSYPFRDEHGEEAKRYLDIKDQPMYPTDR